MRGRVPDMPLASTILWIWIGIVVVSIACWWLVKWWKNGTCRPDRSRYLPARNGFSDAFVNGGRVSDRAVPATWTDSPGSGSDIRTACCQVDRSQRESACTP